MFDTSIHWTTFFYLLIDTAIVLFAFYQSKILTRCTLNRFINLGIIFLLFNLTTGFLPIIDFPDPFISQYIVSYGVAMTLCLYIIYYLYKEFNITILEYNSSLRNLSILVGSCFILLFLIPYFFTNSLILARYMFKIPISIIAIIFAIIFIRSISNPKNPSSFTLRRKKLSIISVVSIALLPIITTFGSYQWLTSTVMNTAFYAITIIEIDRYLYALQNQYKIAYVHNPNWKLLISEKNVEGFLYKLTRMEVKIFFAILNDSNYKGIGQELHIADSTVSKHASNIFKKLEVKNRLELIKKYGKFKDFLDLNN